MAVAALDATNRLETDGGNASEVAFEGLPWPSCRMTVIGRYLFGKMLARAIAVDNLPKRTYRARKTKKGSK